MIIEEQNIVLKAKKQDTKLESEGAEFLVLGLLLIEGVSAYKAYINFPGYDLTAVNPESKRVARIQVKSRWATDYDSSFPLKSLDTDFIVHVALNRGYRFSKKKNLKDNGIKSPTFYVFPVDVLKQVRNETGWNKVQIKKVKNLESYIDNWQLIKDYLLE
ncbi:hypothetical protein [Flavobacterium algicola]|uniref:hypothetical protein n=1 Tax=Flavobacterium algicola TaxID=556529 RepID=UPI001EFCFC70|nr:hypothetical protein [Flavobacterium algicola]MCG9792124.1 hypothetical protein [Flavobacterium algicola]